MATPAAPSKLLLAMAGLNGLLALGHTTKGREQFSHPAIDKLPAVLRGAVKTGWYEGSAFFVIMGILNYKWANTGLVDVFDKSIAGVFVSLLLGAGASYASSGDAGTGVTLAVVALLQGLGAKRAAV
ncbi:uncharacterized protein PV09_04788 [Verruconis gallopava]|uniref:Uncharacterized protein n=1 Tax=Verruconis gallopava TaxID=253628 RepID=A0A0D1XMZ6_9PEZI|nr:uncharacterized protein PV09_04788 [Verruconis gallopava]KIW03951.1 hypothetical protein PV09_04788 [Verruconis gallopava]